MRSEARAVSRSSPVLPVELMLMIFEQADAEASDRPLLKNTRLVDTSFNRAATYLLFSTAVVILTDDESLSRLKHLSQSGYASNVRYLILKAPPHQLLSRQRTWDRGLPAHLPSAQGPKLQRCMRALSSLTTLTWNLRLPDGLPQIVTDSVHAACQALAWSVMGVDAGTEKGLTASTEGMSLHASPPASLRALHILSDPINVIKRLPNKPWTARPSMPDWRRYPSIRNLERFTFLCCHRSLYDVSFMEGISEATLFYDQWALSQAPLKTLGALLLSMPHLQEIDLAMGHDCVTALPFRGIHGGAEREWAHASLRKVRLANWQVLRVRDLIVWLGHSSPRLERLELSRVELQLWDSKAATYTKPLGLGAKTWAALAEALTDGFPNLVEIALEKLWYEPKPSWRETLASRLTHEPCLIAELNGFAARREPNDQLALDRLADRVLENRRRKGLDCGRQVIERIKQMPLAPGMRLKPGYDTFL